MGIYCQFYFSPLFCLTHAFLFYPEKHYFVNDRVHNCQGVGVG